MPANTGYTGAALITFDSASSRQVNDVISCLVNSKDPSPSQVKTTPSDPSYHLSSLLLRVMLPASLLKHTYGHSQYMQLLGLDHQKTASMRLVLNCDPALVRLLASRIDAQQPYQLETYPCCSFPEMLRAEASKLGNRTDTPLLMISDRWVSAKLNFHILTTPTFDCLQVS